MESLASDCIKEFRTANIHSILKVAPDADLDQLKYAIREYLRRNHPDKAGVGATARAQIVNRFNEVFRDANSFLSYVLLAKVRPYYLSSAEKSNHLHFEVEVNRWKRECDLLKDECFHLKNQMKITKNLLAVREETLEAIKLELREKAQELEHLKEENLTLESQLNYFKNTLEQKQSELVHIEMRSSEQLKIKNGIINKIENKLTSDISKLKEALSNEQWSHLETRRRLELKEEQLNYLRHEVKEKMKQISRGKEHLIELLNTVNSELKESYFSLVSLATPTEKEYKSLLDKTIDEVKNRMSRNRRKLNYIRTRIQRESVRLWILGDKIYDVLSLTKTTAKRTVYTPPNSLISGSIDGESRNGDEKENQVNRANNQEVPILDPPQRPERRKERKWKINGMCIK